MTIAKANWENNQTDGGDTVSPLQFQPISTRLRFPTTIVTEPAQRQCGRDLTTIHRLPATPYGDGGM
ncbi:MULTISPECIES: hypothetical protein [unclassified Bradyrhizobium]|uniref:hypothetical protein n=1 Tax=unclassified Bradyrhizobium TaxID=2631580 RepID=UPI00040EFCA3|nr:MULTISPECIES: hypothetical protein [unclassified Bradyrhizobium]QIG98211.1 hypothetical protein G6P99_42500 [Bradyrhizobium sp. 6(2017)]